MGRCHKIVDFNGVVMLIRSVNANIHGLTIMTCVRRQKEAENLVGQAELNKVVGDVADVTVKDEHSPSAFSRCSCFDLENSCEPNKG